MGLMEVRGRGGEHAVLALHEGGYGCLCDNWGATYTLKVSGSVVGEVPELRYAFRQLCARGREASIFDV